MSSTQLAVFVERCARQAAALASTPPVREGADAFLDAFAASEQNRPELRTVPVVAELAGRHSATVGADVDGIVDECSWIASPRGTDEGTQIALCPLNVHFDLGDVVAGFLVAGARQTYPEHSHPPQELYLVLTGDGMWRYGGNDDYEPVSPGTTLYNPPGVTHAVRAGADPVFAFYVLWP